MKHSMLAACVTALATSPVFAQSVEDVARFEDGSVVRGVTIEHVEEQSLRRDTGGGNVFANSKEEIVEITQESDEEAAAAAGGFELGTLFGFNHVSRPSSSHTSIGLPGDASGISLPALYVMWLPSDRFEVGPEFSIVHSSDEYYSSTSAYVAGRLGFHPLGTAVSGPYVRGLAGMRGSSGGGGTLFAAGGGGGYRWRVGPAFVLRVAARYKRWIGPSNYYPIWNGGSTRFTLNEFSLLIGLGAVLGGS